MKNNYLDIKKEDGKIVVSSSDGIFSSIITLDNKEAFKSYCESRAKEWRESILGNYDDCSDEDRKRKSDKWINARNLQCGKYNFYFNIEDKKDMFRKEIDSLAKSLGITHEVIDGKVIANGMGKPILHLWDKGKHLIDKKVKVIVIKEK